MAENKNVNNSNIAMQRRTIILDGVVGEDTVKKAVELIINVNHFDEVQDSYDRKPIKLFVNTVGGSLYDANFLIGAVETSVTPVHTYCYGKAFSAGLYIFASGHKRFATPLATFMYHDGKVGMYDTIHGLDYELQHYTEIRDRYDEYILSVTNLPKHIMDTKKAHKEDWYLTAQEALGYGLVDEILPFRK